MIEIENKKAGMSFKSGQAHLIMHDKKWADAQNLGQYRLLSTFMQKLEWGSDGIYELEVRDLAVSQGSQFQRIFIMSFGVVKSVHTHMAWY